MLESLEYFEFEGIDFNSASLEISHFFYGFQLMGDSYTCQPLPS